MMSERIKDMKRFFVEEKKQKGTRKKARDPYELARVFEKARTPDVDRAAERLCTVLDRETPVVYPFEKIAFTRTEVTIPEIFTESEMEILSKKYHIHEKGDVSNISVDYSMLLSTSFKDKIVELEGYIAGCGDEGKKHYWTLQIRILNSVLSLMSRYVEKAREVGNEVVEKTVSHLLSSKPETLLEAMQMMRIIHFTMWAGRNYHNTLGHLDRYLYPFYAHDISKGILSRDSALELLEEFFLSFNRDSDLYPGMQQGDNGQSLVLGGYDEDGNDTYSDFSELCLLASLDLRLIDPKINLRVSKRTPLERYVLGTHMTKQGLGFPQYSNDDVVIPGLENLGYDKEDAASYVVAACWEFIIPGKAMDIPNLEALSFAGAVRRATVENLSSSRTYDEFLAAVDKTIEEDVEKIISSLKPVYIFPSPFLSLMMEGSTENAKDISLGAKYNNYGIHGSGIATAVDSVMAVKKFVFENGEVTGEEMIKAIESDFENDKILGNRLRYDKDKFGNDTPETNEIADHLLSVFHSALQGRRNDRGGIFRAGTGSAMYYIWHSADMGATPDGRHKGEVIPANYSPSLFTKVNGPVSIIKSFAYPDLRKVINGGPLTIEMHDSIFRSDESVEKVARLIKEYIDLGGHQLQINTVNKDTLLDAQIHPEKYRNLIVRVWGWSGYFVELDKCYQDHIIKRIELTV